MIFKRLKALEKKVKPQADDWDDYLVTQKEFYELEVKLDKLIGYLDLKEGYTKPNEKR